MMELPERMVWRGASTIVAVLRRLLSIEGSESYVEAFFANGGSQSINSVHFLAGREDEIELRCETTGWGGGPITLEFHCLQQGNTDSCYFRLEFGVMPRCDGKVVGFGSEAPYELVRVGPRGEIATEQQYDAMHEEHSWVRVTRHTRKAPLLLVCRQGAYSAYNEHTDGFYLSFSPEGFRTYYGMPFAKNHRKWSELTAKGKDVMRSYFGEFGQ